MVENLEFKALEYSDMYKRQDGSFGEEVSFFFTFFMGLSSTFVIE